MLPDDLFVADRFEFRKESGLLYDRTNNKLLTANQTSLIKETFLEERNFNLWQSCCEQAIRCCKKNSIYLPETRDSSGRLIDDRSKRDVCPATWDGFSCWPDSPAGQLAAHDCPSHLYFLEFTPICPNQVTKQCFQNGSWYVKNDHEWSNYSRCNGQKLYYARLLVATVLHSISLIVIAPSLLVLGKMRQRCETRRVYILRWLLFWLLINSIFSVVNKGGIVSGIFFDERTTVSSKSPIWRQPNKPTNSTTTTTSSNNLSTMRTVRHANHETSSWPTDMDLGDSSSSSRIGDSWQRLISAEARFDELDSSETRERLNEKAQQLAQGRAQVTSGGRRRTARRTEPQLIEGGSEIIVQKQYSATLKYYPTNGQPFWLAFLCWFTSAGLFVARMFYYAWMCTSAIYLCSVLHFSPAEPPPFLMACLMFFTHAIPLGISTTYVLVRELLEPTPLTQLIMVPYYYLKGYPDYATRLKYIPSCWARTSAYDFIEDIADKPHLFLVCLNTFLFVITLVIMCRFKRVPGSNRPETSLWGYFKAAGMLVVLYGAHYILLLQTPHTRGRSCKEDQVMHYTQIIVDSIQGVAVSFVFCYRTSAGREVISKWWNSVKDRHHPYFCVNLCHRRSQRPSSRNQRSLLKQNSRSNRSTGSSYSNCNGKDMTTELSNVNVNSF